MTAAGLSSRDASWFAGRSALLNPGNPGEPGHCCRRQVRQTEPHGLNSGAAEVAGVDPRRRPAQTPVEALDHFVRLGAIGRPQDMPDFTRRPHLAVAHAFRIQAGAGHWTGPKAAPSLSQAKPGPPRVTRR